MKILNLAFAITSLISITSSFPSAKFHQAERKRAYVAANWTYGPDNAGPQDWGNLDPSYKNCSAGLQQSPIDLSLGTYVNLQNQSVANLTFPPLQNVNCGYNGHYVICLYNSTTTNNTYTNTSTSANSTYTNTNSIAIEGTTYNLTNFHFHVPSEHRFNNRFADAELHMVYQSSPTGNETASEAVIGVLLDAQTEDNSFFDWITALENMPGNEQIQYLVKTVDFEGLLNDTNGFTPRWEYTGSLTTPPCTQGIAWAVAQTHVNISLAQLDGLHALQGFSARYLQDRPQI